MLKKDENLNVSYWVSSLFCFAIGQNLEFHFHFTKIVCLGSFFGNKVLHVEVCLGFMVIRVLLEH